MLLQQVRSSQRVVSFALNGFAKTGTCCQSAQTCRHISTVVSLQQPYHTQLHSKCQWYGLHKPDNKLPQRNGLVCEASRPCTTSAAQGERRVYKLMKIKAKDFEKVDPDVKYGGLDPSLVQAGFEDSKELQDADDMVRKVFSLQVANQRQISQKQVKLLNEKIQLDPDNENTLATTVINQTILIRHLSQRLQSFKGRKDVGSKVKLVHMLDKRRKMMKLLRRQNYMQFERVLNELGIEYIPIDKYDFFPQTRRMREKEGIIKEAIAQKRAALDIYMAERRVSQLIEIVQLKKDLGMDLTEEEQERLKNSEGEQQ